MFTSVMAFHPLPTKYFNCYTIILISTMDNNNNNNLGVESNSIR